MKTLLLTSLCCCLFNHGLAQTIMQPVAARYLALGAYSANHVDVYATRANPASLARLGQASAAIYGEKRFMLEGLNLYAASVGLPTKTGTFGANLTYFGASLSNQSQFTLSYGRKIASKIDVGAAFHYQQVSQAGIYGKASAITGSVGLLLHLTDKIHAGVNVYNPIRAAYGKGEVERLPSQYSFGMGFEASDKLFITGELVKEESQNLNVNAGFQYQFIPQFFIRAGIATQTTNYFAGLGFKLKDFRLDVASSYHPQLGFTPGLMLLYAFGKKPEEASQ